MLHFSPPQSCLCLGVSRFLDPEDIDVRHPEKQAVLTYVTELYHKLAKHQKEQTKGRQIAKLVKTLKEIENMQARYKADVNALRNWIQDTENRLNDRNFPQRTDELKAELNSFKNDYLGKEKPRKMMERDRVEGDLVLIHQVQAAIKQSRWMPEVGMTLHDIENDWNRLEAAEHNRQQALHAALQRFVQSNKFL